MVIKKKKKKKKKKRLDLNEKDKSTKNIAIE
jgi:hypothetical protein